jgi:hypothetical protein
MLFVCAWIILVKHSASSEAMCSAQLLARSWPAYSLPRRTSKNCKLLIPSHVLHAPHFDVVLLQYATRTCLAAAGLPTPRNARISVKADVAAAAHTVGFPAVIKPVSGV